MYKKNERSAENYDASLDSYATKSCMSTAILGLYNQPPNSILFNQHYCADANKDNIAEKLRDPRYQGIIIRPSSQKYHTTISFGNNDQIENHVFSNIELREQISAFEYYRLDLGDQIIALVQDFVSGKKHDQDFHKHINLGLKAKVQKEIDDINYRAKILADRYRMDY